MERGVSYLVALIVAKSTIMIDVGVICISNSSNMFTRWALQITDFSWLWSIDWKCPVHVIGTNFLALSTALFSKLFDSIKAIIAGPSHIFQCFLARRLTAGSFSISP